MSTPELDRRLAEFLDRSPVEKSKLDDALDEIKAAVGRVANEQNLLRQAVEAESKMVQSQFKGLNARVDKLEDDVEDTGVHNLESIKHRADEETKKKDRLMGYIVTAAGTIALLLLGGAGSVIWYLITRPH